MDVTIDGVPYAPAAPSGTSGMAPHHRIGVAIKTHNRPDILRESLRHHAEHLVPGAVYVVVDDGSTVPVGDVRDLLPYGSVVRHDTPLGIVAAGNRALEELMAAHVDHLFVWDDDAYPIADDWWAPYLASPEPHLMAQFLELAAPEQRPPRRGVHRRLRDMQVLYEDTEHVAYSAARGYMLYFHRSAIEAVGGFDPVYGRGMYEHADLSSRIHAAGLTTWRFADVVGSDKLVRSRDQFLEVERSVPLPERRQLAADNGAVYAARWESGHTGYVEYRRQRDVVLTCLYSRQDDPQRPGKRLDPTLAPAKTMVTSVMGAEVVVFADQVPPSTGGSKVTVLPSELRMPLFFQRHLEAWRWLRDHPEVRYVWCVDATDVEMLRAPWADMEPGALYLGWEPKLVGDEWMTKHHTATKVAEAIDRHRHRTLLNAGLIGGDRATVMAFLHGMLRVYFDHQIGAQLGGWSGDVGSDMGALNAVAYDQFSSQLRTGPQVATVFRANEQNGWSWWRHK